MTTRESRPVAGTDPRTGSPLAPGAVETTPDGLDEIVAAAADAAPALEALGRAGRARLLRALARALDRAREEIVAAADAETALGPARLGGELTRTVYQLEFFAGVLDDGGYVEATIDLAGETPMGPRPDLRRMLVPIGPVAVFGASNFPLAFSVPGGDTASALAAGNPVVVKAHGSHPGTSRLVHELLQKALTAAGLPAGTLGLVFGRTAGERLVAHPAIKAVGFTGSLSGGRALLDIIGTRPEPIPFYGELSSLNALVVTAAAARERPGEIGTGLIGSVTASSGQLCTKPGLVLVPAGADGDAVVEAARSALGDAPVIPLLNQRIHQSYLDGTARLTGVPGVSTVARGVPSAGGGFWVAPWLASVDAADMPDEAFAEYFGPAAVVARYSTQAELRAVVDRLPASLTATVHLGADEKADELVAALGRRAGRLVFNGYPTGVSVGWAQHHGGPWPSTNSLHTSVGATAIRRFLRPLAWQNAPVHLLPDELSDEPVCPLPRRVNGELRVPR
ncbi:aldehyde dehydrogenase (NADP(+)) [Amycolatopsis thermophila]|uniref:NADP-dependent aldehyde dehydrogenase n=1 Tax=Amycolatopsis thermophila TaxID=206084 RepID=A0ABU0F147_9PSEU|nr:aldehyde dehydrogenase (NADP(+)) [Amycolatopsis thermophila]MDQ0380916.1 NADP-dependent aldehyde dehydrogenase [Amycolatopsis thermophila]